MAHQHAADAAAAVVTCRHEVSQLLASAALGGSTASSDRIASAMHLVQTACDTLDQTMADNEKAVSQAEQPLLEAARRAWSVHAPSIYPPTGPPPPQVAADLLAAAVECVPPWLASRSHAPLKVSERSVGGRAGEAPRRTLELQVDGAFTAVIDFIPAGGEGGTHTPSGSEMWVPSRVAVGPWHEPMPYGASEPPRLHVFADLTARAGVILAGLDALPPHRRLRPLIVWLSSLHNVFTCACTGSGQVFPPDATSAHQLLPPTARGADLRPYHPGVFRERFGRSAEEDYLEAAALMS